MIVHVTDLALIENMWPTLAPIFARATRLSSGCYEPDDVLADIRNGAAQLWVEWDNDLRQVDAAMSTSIHIYPRRKSVRVNFIAGKNMRRWFEEFAAAVENFARQEGAHFIEGHYRKGWGRVWKGCRENGVGFYKDMTP
jgi:hypothetical protein